jgi:hypothetical protein
MMHALRRLLFVLSLALAASVTANLALEGEAQAQYRSFTFGFEGGYMNLAGDTALKAHNPALGLFGGYKADDHWWFYSKALVAFPGQLDNAPNTVILLHLVPASARYYFATDRIRPWAGITTAFQSYFNVGPGVPQDIWWGPGVNAGVDVKLRRDLYLGLAADAFYMFNFDGPDAEIFTISSVLTFFL